MRSFEHSYLGRLQSAAIPYICRIWTPSAPSLTYLNRPDHGLVARSQQSAISGGSHPLHSQLAATVIADWISLSFVVLIKSHISGGGKSLKVAWERYQTPIMFMSTMRESISSGRCRDLAKAICLSYNLSLLQTSSEDEQQCRLNDFWKYLGSSDQVEHVVCLHQQLLEPISRHCHILACSTSE